MSIAHLRKEYTHAHLSESDTDPDPIAQFGKWFHEALNAKILEPNAMSVATVGASGRPSSRILLIKEYDQRGFTWFTNYTSRKGVELAHNPNAAILFHWIELERQVRIEGRVERLTPTENDAYFASRPLESQLSAIASQQSAPIAHREELEEHLKNARAQFGDTPERPEHWGGYRLIPDTLEFWQGRSSRLHDRILYSLLPNGSWQRSRLQP